MSRRSGNTVAVGSVIRREELPQSTVSMLLAKKSAKMRQQTLFSYGVASSHGKKHEQGLTKVAVDFPCPSQNSFT